MKFDFCIGNPPFQDSEKINNRQGALYQFFYDAAESITDKYLLISPARFLYNTGFTSKEWNRKMLSDKHIKIEQYEPNSSKIFPSTNIKGGVAIVYHDGAKEYEPIGEFIPDEHLRSIASRFRDDAKSNLPSIMFGGRSDLKFNDVFLNEYPDSIDLRIKAIQKKHPDVEKLNQNEEYELKSSTFDVLGDYGIHDKKMAGINYFEIIGLYNGTRTIKYIECRHMEPRYMLRNNIWKYKVFVPESNGSGAIGEVLSTPLIGTPLIGTPLMSATPTFISIGSFETKTEASNLLKYIKTKLVRTLLGIKKKTQHNPPSMWSYVPIQDFTADSDIDWSQSVQDIDRQLYRKYNLSQEEIDFIETHVKEMQYKHEGN